MSVLLLQQRLKAEGFDPGPLDGLWGGRTRSALEAALVGSTFPLAAGDISQAAAAIAVTPAHVRAVLDVESNGRGLHPTTKRPIILYEPHKFHAFTGGRHAAQVDLSYPAWGTRPYPDTQAERYDQLMRACRMDWQAALRATSWGLFQILGDNFAAAGAASVWDFVRGQLSEATQLRGFVALLQDWRLDKALREGRWADFARAYNGKSYARHGYDQKLKAAFRRHGGK